MIGSLEFVYPYPTIIELAWVTEVWVFHTPQLLSINFKGLTQKLSLEYCLCKCELISRKGEHILVSVSWHVMQPKLIALNKWLVVASSNLVRVESDFSKVSKWSPEGVRQSEILKTCYIMYGGTCLDIAHIFLSRYQPRTRLLIYSLSLSLKTYICLVARALHWCSHSERMCEQRERILAWTCSWEGVLKTKHDLTWIMDDHLWSNKIHDRSSVISLRSCMILLWYIHMFHNTLHQVWFYLCCM